MNDASDPIREKQKKLMQTLRAKMLMAMVGGKKDPEKKSDE